MVVFFLHKTNNNGKVVTHFCGGGLDTFFSKFEISLHGFRKKKNIARCMHQFNIGVCVIISLNNPCKFHAIIYKLY